MVIVQMVKEIQEGSCNGCQLDHEVICCGDVRELLGLEEECNGFIFLVNKVEEL